jgi:hypothetical protein
MAEMGHSRPVQPVLPTGSCPPRSESDLHPALPRNDAMGANHDISLRDGIWSLSGHSGLWPAERPEDLWVHGLDNCVSSPAIAELFTELHKYVFMRRGTTAGHGVNGAGTGLPSPDAPFQSAGERCDG